MKGETRKEKGKHTMSTNKKNTKRPTIENIVLATAILDLFKEIFEIVRKLLN